MKTWLLIAALALVVPQTVFGGDFDNTTETLLSNCEMFLKYRTYAVPSSTTAARVLDCHSYIFGFVDGINAGDGPPLACIPDGVNVLQLVKAFVKWAQIHPRHFWQQSRQLGVSTAFVTTWPCKTKNQTRETP